MSKTIVPYAVPMAYAATGVRAIKCGRLILFSAAHRSSEVHVIIGADGGADGGGLVRTVGTTGFNGRAEGIFLTMLVSVQLNAEFVPAMTGGDEMVSSGMVGVEEHPARRIAAPTKMAAGLNIRSLCGWRNWTQAVSYIYDLRCAIDATTAIHS
jgi:hypothetical protein